MSGVTTTFDYDNASDMTIVGYEQDVSSLLDANKKLQNDPEHWKQGVKNSWVQYASYPAIIVMQWMKDYGVDVLNKNHAKKVLELTNRPEYRYLKTTTKMIRG